MDNKDDEMDFSEKHGVNMAKKVGTLMTTSPTCKMFSYEKAEYVLGKMTRLNDTRLELIWIPFDNVFCRGTYKGMPVDRKVNRIGTEDLCKLGLSSLAARYRRFSELTDAWEEITADEENTGLLVKYLRANGFRIKCKAEKEFLERRKAAKRKLRQSGLTLEELETLGFFKLSEDDQEILGPEFIVPNI